MLTSQQKQTLKTYVQNDATLNAAWLAGNMSLLFTHFNTLASPNFTVWKTMVTVKETGDSIDGGELAGLTGLNIDRLSCVIQLSEQGINPSLPDRREFFNDIFSGAGGTQTRANLLVLWKRLATYAEKLYATGTGSDAVPAVMTFEGMMTDVDIQGAMQS